MSFRNNFEATNKSFEESGSLIWIYRCKICDREVPKYARSVHNYIHSGKSENK